MWKSPNEFQSLKRKEWYMLISIPLFSVIGVIEMFRIFIEIENRQFAAYFVPSYRKKL